MTEAHRAYQSSDTLPERPGWRAQYTVRDGYLVGMAWQPYAIEIQGRRSVGYQFRCTGVAKLTRKGEMGRGREVTDYSGLYEAHRVWVEAGRPATWEWRH